jgi:hypothetical protein
MAIIFSSFVFYFSKYLFVLDLLCRCSSMVAFLGSDNSNAMGGEQE